MLTEADFIHAKKVLHDKVPVFAASVAPAYQGMKWTWWQGIIPSVDQIEKSAHRLIDDIDFDPRDSYIESGGLRVRVYLNPRWKPSAMNSEIFHVDDDFHREDTPRVYFALEFTYYEEGSLS